MANKKNIKNFFRFSGDLFRILEFILDVSMILLGFYLASYVRDAIVYRDSNFIHAFLEILGVLEKRLILPDGPFTKNGILVSIYGNSFVYIILSFIFINIYDASLYKKNFKNTMFSYAILLIIMNTILIVVAATFKYGSIAPSSYFTAIFIQFILLFGTKNLYWKMIKRSLNKNTLIVTTKEQYESITLKVIEDKNIRDIVKCIYIVEKDKLTKELLELIKSYDVVHISSDLSSDFKNKLISYVIGKEGKIVKLVPKLYELSINGSEYKNIDDKLTLNIEPLKSSIEQRFFKRTFDIVFSLVGIILAMPFLMFGAILIKLDDKGPIFYSQERITKGNKPFKIYKVRSMSVNAEKATGAVLSTKGDSRITRVGKFIRATRIDEIPQLWNILKGEMSFVGPRPERQVFIDEICKDNPKFAHRTNVKAGLAGYAQYKGKYTTTFIDKLRLDLYYIRNQSFLLDMKIILATILTVLNKDAAEGSFDDSSFEERLSRLGLTVIPRNKNIIIIK